MFLVLQSLVKIRISLFENLEPVWSLNS